jgi:hypothetical protein
MQGAGDREGGGAAHRTIGSVADSVGRGGSNRVACGAGERSSEADCLGVSDERMAIPERRDDIGLGYPRGPCDLAG